MFRAEDFYLGLGSKIFEKCTYTNCYTTHIRNKLPVEKFDAVIFHGVEYRRKAFGVPEKRNPNQIYIYSNMESPDNTPISSETFQNFYNWTMTYRLDSDILRPYGFVEKKKTNYRMPTIEEIQKRPKKIAWFVSNCGTASLREELYNEMKKHIQIDVYGKCGSLRCDKHWGDECYDLVEKQYKFYLSFENSICEDYVTEKLYNLLKYNIVPIVYGLADYNTLAPPKSVINVMDFKSVKKLVAYIEFLDTHPEEYRKFFEWKRDYVVDTSNSLTLCTLCQKLNEPIQPKIYSDVVKWWTGENNDKCINSDFLREYLAQT